MPKDSTPNWKPLEQLFSKEVLAEFMYMGCIGTIEQYKHRDTRCYLNIDSVSGVFYLQFNHRFVPVSRGTALGYVFG